jgi:site-specific recombinase XerD
MARQRINRELIRKLQAQNKAAPKLREIYDDQITGFGARITPKGTVSFLYRWTQPDGTQARKTLGIMADEADVAEARVKVLQEIRRVDHVRDTPAVRVQKHERRVADRNTLGMPTLGEYLDGDYRTYWLGATQSETPEVNLKAIRRDFAEFMDVRLDEVTRPMVKRWIEKRVAAKHKASAINRTLGSLGGLFSHAVEHERIEVNPCAKLRQKVDPEEAERLGRELTIDEEQRLRAALDAREAAIRAGDQTLYCGRKQQVDVPGEHHAYVDHVKPAILLALNTGVRRSELMRLRWTSVDWQAKTLTVEPWTTKVKRRRVLPLNAEALAVLKAWRRQTKYEFVFTNEIGERMREVRDWSEIKAAAQITGFRFMDARHHTATRMINEGVPVYHVQKVLGHSDSRMTQRYLKARNEKLQEALAVLDRPRIATPAAEAA